MVSMRAPRVECAFFLRWPCPNRWRAMRCCCHNRGWCSASCLSFAWANETCLCSRLQRWRWRDSWRRPCAEGTVSERPCPRPRNLWAWWRWTELAVTAPIVPVVGHQYLFFFALECEINKIKVRIRLNKFDLKILFYHRKRFWWEMKIRFSITSFRKVQKRLS